MENKRVELTEQERASLADLNTKKETLTNEINSIAQQKLVLNYRERQADKYYEQIVELEGQLGKSFTQKYGNGTIDIENGVFIPS